MNAGQVICISAVRFYRMAISPVLTVIFTPLGFGCRFRPTCSEYAAEAIRSHGVVKGVGLAMRRLGKCHPWGGSGDDPVPGRNPND